MAIEAIVTDKAPAASAPTPPPWPPGHQGHPRVGQLPVSPATASSPRHPGPDPSEPDQHQNILRPAPLAMADVAEVTVLLDDIADFAAMNEVYGEFFTAPYPSRAAFEVAALPKAAKVEIKAVAYL